ncbi:MAG: hypothetical protein GXO26_06850 [Crenarchaeota archaeon]|nr:hypothetical protein [Thermoproteota archaeon]
MPTLTYIERINQLKERLGEKLSRGIPGSTLLKPPYDEYSTYYDVDLIMPLETVLGLRGKQLKEWIEATYIIVDKTAKRCDLERVNTRLDLYKIIADAIPLADPTVSECLEKLQSFVRSLGIKSLIQRVYELYTYYVVYARDKLISSLKAHGVPSEIVFVIDRNYIVLQSLYRTLRKLVEQRPNIDFRVLERLSSFASFFEFVLTVIMHIYERQRRKNLQQLFMYTNWVHLDITALKLAVKHAMAGQTEQLIKILKL